MVTAAQIEANRMNARSYCGPRTETGKANSRRNSLKHGLTGNGIVLPEAEAKAVRDRTILWGLFYRILTDEERWLMRQVALQTVRIDRCQEEDRTLRIQRAIRAEVCWDDDRKRAAELLFTRLPDEPGLVALELQRTPQGCQLLARHWEGLAALLKPGTPWDSTARALANDLLGIHVALREAPIRIDPKPGEEAVEHQRAVAMAEIARLRTLQTDVLDELDGMERDVAMFGLAAPDRDQRRLMRYEAACYRRYRDAMDRLEPLRYVDSPLLALGPQPNSLPASAADAEPDRTESPLEAHPPVDPEPAPSVDPASFALIPEPKPVDPFEERKPTLDEMITMLKSTVRAEERAEARKLESPGMAPMSPVDVFGPKPAPSRVLQESRRRRKGRRRRDGVLAT